MFPHTQTGGNSIKGQQAGFGFQIKRVHRGWSAREDFISGTYYVTLNDENPFQIDTNKKNIMKKN